MTKFKSLAIALTFCLLCTGALYAAPVTNGSTITWSADKAAGGISLTVSGPAGFHYEETRKGAIALSLFDEAGYPMADGAYNYSLVTIPSVDFDRSKMDAAALAEWNRQADANRVSGSFRVIGGTIVVAEAAPETGSDRDIPLKDNVIVDDLIVDGSACVGMDCANGENFGFDTLRLKENNLRIKFQDTSASASFPGNDWQLTANSSDNGGDNYFSIDDVDGGKTPFRVDAGAPSNALRVEDTGDIGVGNGNPVVELHVTDGDSPTLRLEQDGSSGFTAQTFDIAANETNFFVRDVTNSSSLPFRIRPGAGTNSIYIDGDGDILNQPVTGTSSPNVDASFKVQRSDETASIKVVETSSTEALRGLLTLENNGGTGMTITDTSADGQSWSVLNSSNGNFAISAIGSGVTELQVEHATGDLTIAGALMANAGANVFPDYVFEDDYQLMPLNDLKGFIDTNGHLPNIPSATDVENNGNQINMTELQRLLLEKVEELTLYTLQQQDTIELLKGELENLKGE